MAPTIVSRTAWGARPPRSVATVAWSDRTGVAVHHSAGPTSQTVRQIQDFHMDVKGWSDIGYNFLVDQAGLLYEGRGWTARGTHSAGENVSHVAVCWVGNSTAVEPTAVALATIRWVYDEACRLAGRVLQYSGHGQLPGENTQCPGDQLRTWIAQGMPTTEGGPMELSTQLDNVSPARTVNDALAGSLQLRNWAVSPPESTGQGFPPDGSRGAVLVDAALAILDGSAVLDPQAVADALAGNEVFLDELADRIAARVTQRPMNVALSASLSGPVTGTATPVDEPPAG